MMKTLAFFLMFVAGLCSGYAAGYVELNDKLKDAETMVGLQAQRAMAAEGKLRLAESHKDQ